MPALLLSEGTRLARKLDGRPDVAARVAAASCPKHGDYALRCAEAEILKVALRWRYYRAEAQHDLNRATGFDYAAQRARSWEMWAEYEDINRRLIPEDPVYSGTRAGVTLSTSADLWTYTAASAGQSRALEISIGGEATATGVNRVGVYNSTSGATPTNQTMEKFSTRSPAAAGTFATAWTTQPTLNTNPVLWMAFNAFGGGDKWVAQPGAELYVVNSEKISSRSNAGTSVVSAHLIIEEM
jgi:hypothetical protein